MSISYKRHLNNDENDRVEFLMINFDYIDGNDLLAKYFNEVYGMVAETKLDEMCIRDRGKSKACFATLAERKTRFYIAVKMPDRRAETMENAIVAALSAFPPQLVKTITCDRGTEFANWRRIEERLHCEVYFADPYCA